jgi:ribosome-associated heat shock protein Hsp15
MDRSPVDPLHSVRAGPQRLDSWLDVSCLFKTRSAAARACDGGKVDVDGIRGKAHKVIRPGDRIEISVGSGRKKMVRVLATCERSIPKSEARRLYEDLTPPPSPEEMEARRYERLSRPVDAGRPDSRDRRSLRKLKGR